MKIVKLQSENIKRLHAVEITPEGALIRIAGKNGAGKSSVLDSIAYAMGGERLVPSEPIRAGEAEAKVVVDLGDLVVTRRFKRDHMLCDCDGSTRANPENGLDHMDDCASRTFGETKSTLTVTNKDGARYPSPQAVLDRLLGRLTFDPLQFARDEPKKQDETLRRLVGLDLAPVEERRKAAFAQRAMLKKSHDIKAAQLLALPYHKDAPEVEVSMDGVSKEMLAAEAARKQADDAQRDVDIAQMQVTQLETNCQKRYAVIEELRKRLEEEQAAVGKIEVQFLTAKKELDRLSEALEVTRAAVPDVAVIRQKLAETETTNAKVRANQKYLAVQAEVEGIMRDVEVQHQAVLTAEEEKRAALEAAQFPVAGLGLDDEGVTFHNLPFAQAGSAEQMRVSVAIGIALNPTLKVLLIRNGNMLDGDSLRAVAAQAEDAGMQVWMEFVAETKDGVSVMLEDGAVV